ncbi:unnamed protein product [Clavelina lepadiformis]|uniref:C-type lectin domain-containing protein n=1 Tax=Clavelina lepadiformis TaxID=159417 RepID=A0ABP0FGJ1_CLALP
MRRFSALLFFFFETALAQFDNPYRPNNFYGGPQPLVCSREARNSSDPNILKKSGETLSSLAVVPEPYRRYCVWERGNICNTETFESSNGTILLEQDMDVDRESFSIFAHIRLRPRNGFDNWGGRIISKRTSTKRGWQFVVPSFYGRKISLYMNDDPGHITYGETVIPTQTWITVAITINRDEFRPAGLATVQAYFNGIPDGSPYIVKIDNTLATEAPLTIGHWMYEDHTFHEGRKDLKSPNRKNHVHKFFGDIRDLTVWKSALSSSQLLRFHQFITTKNGELPRCPPDWRRFGCKCYKVFSFPMHYDMAWATCTAERGRLVVIDTPEIQDFVWGLVVSSSEQDFWIGLNDTVSESVWRFSNGYNLNYYIGQWNNFPAGYPDKEYKTDDCAELKKIKAGKWNDTNCNKYNSFICERGPRTCN